MKTPPISKITFESDEHQQGDEIMLDGVGIGEYVVSMQNLRMMCILYPRSAPLPLTFADLYAIADELKRLNSD